MQLPALSPAESQSMSRLPAHHGTAGRRVASADSSLRRRQKAGQHVDEQAEVVRSLCKTYTHATQKLLYAFQALNEQSGREDGSKSITQALATSARAALLEHLSTTLACGVERILRTPDLSCRAATLRDLRARFDVKENKATVDAGTQCERRSTPRRPSNVAAAAPAPEPAAKVEEKAAESAEKGEEAVDEKQAKELRQASAVVQRLREWEKRRASRLSVAVEKQAEKEIKEAMPSEAEVALRRRASLRYSHVESAIKKELREEEESKVAAAEKRADDAFERASTLASRLEVEEAERTRVALLLEASEEARAEMEESLAEAHARMEAAEQRYAKVKKESDAAVEIAEAFGSRKLEVWPMLPNKKILRVLGAEEFDGRVSSEFRVKDEESGERGVSLLMGRCNATRTHEVQCVLFDPKYVSDLQAARWWNANGHRFERAEQRIAAFADKKPKEFKPASRQGFKRAVQEDRLPLSPNAIRRPPPSASPMGIRA